MKRVVFTATLILVILLVGIYVFIPSTITAGKTVSVKCVNKNVLVLIGNKQGWSRWLPKESFTSDLIQYKGYQLKLGSATYSSVVFDALKDADVVIVAIGEDFGASIMVTALFKQLKVKRLISRSINKVHETVINAIGVDEIIHPEEDSAERMAKKLQMKDVLDSLDVSEDYNIIEVTAPAKYVGSTIAETQIRQNYNIIMVKTLPSIYQPR